MIAGDTTSDLPWTVYQLGVGSGCLPDGGIDSWRPTWAISSRHAATIAGGRAWMSMTTRWAKAHSLQASSASMCQRWSSRSLMDLESVRRSRRSHPSSPIGRSTSRRSEPFNKESSRRWRLMDRRCCGRASDRGWIVRTGVCAASVSALERRSLRARMSLLPIGLVELDGKIELQDDLGTTLASVPVSSDLLTLRSHALVIGGGWSSASRRQRPRSSSNTCPWPEGWDLTQWARLRDGTVVFWSQTAQASFAPAGSPPSTMGAIRCRRSTAILRPSPARSIGVRRRDRLREASVASSARLH